MRITVLGVLALIGIVGLLIYVGFESNRTNQAKASPLPPNRPFSINS
jgi:hypothetical protein